ncbi:diguanylate cyclase [uncultured Clostridium sp.]|uniref:diguanylate cyclase n=1 Tax=uncultured Clostridium sp. TaxID=59620 RepID=UPI0025DD846E|nr:diguanylate cyclase [uncultured Clostridium sp.]
MFKRYRKFLLILIGIILILSVFFHINKQNTDTVLNIENGEAELSDTIDLSKNNVSLNGNWDFYYNELLSPSDLKNRTANDYYNIPGRLSDQTAGAKSGYMTLHLKMHVPEDDIYGLYFYRIFTSSKIWINGVDYGERGKVADNIDEEKATYRAQYVFFPSQNKEIDIVINTSVYREMEPQLLAPVFGLKDNIMKINYFHTAVDGLILGIVFMMLLINCGLCFAQRQSNRKKHIYFSIICIILILRCLIFNSRLLFEFFPDISFELCSKCSALTFYLWVTFYILFLNEVFYNKIAIAKSAVLFGTCFSLLGIFTDNMIYDRIQKIPQAITDVFMIYLTYFFLREIKNKNKEVKLNFISFAVLCVTAINDMLVNNAVLPKQYSALYGGALFAIIESIYILTDYINNIKKLENINKDGLTSLYNNRYIKTLISNLIKRYTDNKEIFSLVMIDIDNFKSINDTYGHMHGDTVILDVATIVLDMSDKKEGYAGRFGGDEFILILPGCNAEEAYEAGKDIMKKLDRLNKIKVEYNPVSLSVGVYENVSRSIEECMQDVDSALYKSKTSGKNQINIIKSDLESNKVIINN